MGAGTSAAAVTLRFSGTVRVIYHFKNASSRSTLQPFVQHALVSLRLVLAEIGDERMAFTLLRGVRVNSPVCSKQHSRASW